MKFYIVSLNTVILVICDKDIQTIRCINRQGIIKLIISGTCSTKCLNFVSISGVFKYLVSLYVGHEDKFFSRCRHRDSVLKFSETCNKLQRIRMVGKKGKEIYYYESQQTLIMFSRRSALQVIYEYVFPKLI